VEIDEEVGNYAVADQRKGLANITMKWAAGDEYVYFLLTEQGATNLYRITPDGAYERIVGGNSVTFEYSPAVGGKVAYGQANPANPGELYLWQNGAPQPLSDFNPWLRDHRLSMCTAPCSRGISTMRCKCTPTPDSSGMRGTSGVVVALTGKLDEEKHLEPLQRQSLNDAEVTGDEPVCRLLQYQAVSCNFGC